MKKQIITAAALAACMGLAQAQSSSPSQTTSPGSSSIGRAPGTLDCPPGSTAPRSGSNTGISDCAPAPSG
ncbi:MAG TPA: hypothetical protein VGE22_17010, partial [Solimonas sp.]